VILICNGLLSDERWTSRRYESGFHKPKWDRSRTERGPLVEWNEDDPTGESGPFSPALPCPPSFSLVQRHATPHGTLSPIHTVCCTRLLHTLVHCEPPPTQALVLPRPLLLSSLLAPFFTFGCTPLTVSIIFAPCRSHVRGQEGHHVVVCHMAPGLHWLRTLVVVVGIYYTCGCNPHISSTSCPTKCSSCTTE
jgi:hypothetical protein